MLSDRLIENWLPINELSIESIREGGALAGHPPVNQLHVWWARRPLIASRAAIAGSMLPADYDRDLLIATLGTTTEVVTARKMMDAVKAMGKWSNITYPNKRAFNYIPTPEEAETFKEGAFRATGVKEPTVLDLTAGGGSIPFEAGRLGLKTIANELNPVACFILKATCEWPQRFGNPLVDEFKKVSAKFLSEVTSRLESIYPDEKQPDCAGGRCPHPQRIKDPVGHPAVRAQRYAQTYLWARTAKCPNCEGTIPLSPNWRLDSKGTGISLEPNGQECRFRLIHDRSICPDCKSDRKQCHTATLYPDGRISEGTVANAIALCPQINCGATTPKGFLAREAQAGRMNHQLYCVVYRDSWYEDTKNGRRKKRPTTFRGFVEPEQWRDNGNYVASELERRTEAWKRRDILPDEAVPEGNSTRSRKYGTLKWTDMFNPRQLLAHGICVEAFQDLVNADEQGGQLNELRKASWGYVALAIDKMLGRNNSLCRWVPQQQTVGNLFDTHDFGFKWSYGEMAISVLGLGLEWALNDLNKCIVEIVGLIGHNKNGADGPIIVSETVPAPTALPTRVINCEAQFIPEIEDSSIDCIVFDPPYHDNVCYAELSDFFYVWLKRTAGYVFPEQFVQDLTEKDLEAIASPIRFKSTATRGNSARKQATADYETKMAEIFAEAHRVIKPNGVMTVMFNHKSTAAWDALIVALIESGFSVTRTWPIKTEAESSMHIRGKAAARTTILLACRPRKRNLFPKPWQEVERQVARAVQNDIHDNLNEADLSPIDLYLSAFGPALRVISEHWGTERDSARPDYDPTKHDNPFVVTPTDALQVAREEVSKHRADIISREWANHPADLATRFYILASDAAGGNTILFDEANLLSRAIGSNLDKKDPKVRTLVAFKSDKVTLLTARERMAAGYIGENQATTRTLDTVHTAVALTNRRNSGDAINWLNDKGQDPQDKTFKSTLEALVRITKPGHDDFQAQRNLWQSLYAAEPPQPVSIQMPFDFSEIRNGS